MEIRHNSLTVYTMYMHTGIISMITSMEAIGHHEIQIIYTIPYIACYELSCSDLLGIYRYSVVPRSLLFQQ